ncbi:hypothetical protein [Lentzea terrae]|nr:hypothetical protein [Lentzea terrae]
MGQPSGEYWRVMTPPHRMVIRVRRPAASYSTVVRPKDGSLAALSLSAAS